MKKTLLVIVTGISFFACKKEKADTPGCAVTMENLSGSYKLTALQYKLNPNAAPADYLAFLDTCEKDNIIILKSDGAYQEEDAGTVCVPSETTAGTWQLRGDTLTSDGTVNGTIATFDCKRLVFYVDNTVMQGDRLTYTIEKQ
jgi:lipocalin-like protein